MNQEVRGTQKPISALPPLHSESEKVTAMSFLEGLI